MWEEAVGHTECSFYITLLKDGALTLVLGPTVEERLPHTD